ncbi:malonyl-CoA decarboxylase [Prosthecomicrobium sp. N25]|uniref:malonyl-CoA decarboxylase n=1 Tax=Prosthecomicrobium sp. N25 TaxID=3129254 RepID=UPI003076E4A4
MNINYMAELLATVSERASRLVGLGPKPRPALARTDIAVLAADLVSHRGEASGVAIAAEILSRYAGLAPEERIRFLTGLVERFGPDEERVARAVEAWRRDPSPLAVSELHIAAEPLRQELLRRLNLAPGGTLALVRLRADVLELTADEPALKVLDTDLVHLFSSWFNRGFLVVRRIDWSTPANILEKLIAYEAVHEIDGWDDLRRRIEPTDRRCYAFFHPQLADEPLIFVEVALTAGIPEAVAPLLAPDRAPLPAKEATTAVFYSISNCQAGLAGISFGSFLIKQVVEELKRDLPQLAIFVTLSPAPGFARWLDQERNSDESPLTPAERQVLDALDSPGWHRDPAVAGRVEPVLKAAAARYYLEARTDRGRPVDPVARFHLGNGARLERIDHLGDVSARGLEQAYGLMVNYLYDLDRIEENHEAYAERKVVAASPAVRALLKRESSRELA